MMMKTLIQANITGTSNAVAFKGSVDVISSKPSFILYPVNLCLIKD